MKKTSEGDFPVCLRDSSLSTHTHTHTRSDMGVRGGHL